MPHYSKPIETTLVKLAERVLDTTFDTPPTINFVNSKEIEEIRKAGFRHLGHPKDGERKKSNKITYEVVDHQGQIFFNEQCIMSIARRDQIPLTVYNDFLKLHVLGHTFLKPIIDPIMRKAIAQMIAAYGTERAVVSEKGFWGSLRDATRKQATSEYLQYKDFIRSVKICQESFCDFVATECADLMSVEKLDLAMRWNSRRPEIYRYVDFFYFISGRGFKYYYPFLDFPDKAPDEKDLWKPSRYLRDIPQGKKRFPGIV